MKSRLVRVLAPFLYATTSVALTGLTARASAAFGRPIPLPQLLDPRACWWLRGEPYTLLLVLGALVAAVWHKRQQWILLTFAACLLFTILDVLWFAGNDPKKVDLRLLYSLQSAANLVWHAALCALASFCLLWRTRREGH